MKAAAVFGPNQTPRYAEFDDPAPRDGFTIVDVAASALSTATRARATGSHYSLAGSFPLVPGIDGVGRTEDGRRVGFLLPEAPYGGMAEQTLVRDALCLPVPDGLSDVMAAAILNPGQSPLGALGTRADLQPGETVLINGATGITGQIAVQIAKHLGAGRVIVTGRNAAALATLAELGADHTIDLGAEPGALQADLDAYAGGIDVVLDYLSGSPTETVLAALARHRPSTPVRYVIAGAAAGTSTTITTSVLGSMPIALMGSGIGAVSLPQLVQAAQDALQIAGSIQLQVDVDEVPLSAVAEAWAADHGRRRVVFTV
jgi:NADPH:quinone reductase-like Zn-dependent oxidoreductase